VFTLARDDSPYADGRLWKAGRIEGEGTHTCVAVIWDSIRELSEHGPLLPLAMVWALHEHGVCYLKGLQALLSEEEEERKMAKLQQKYSSVVGKALLN
jgi:hypothetical protein